MISKKAQANIIVVVLIILIVLAAIIILWNVVNIFLENSTGEVNLGFVLNQAELISAQEIEDGGIDLRIRKLRGKSEMTELAIYINYEDGTLETIKKTNNLPAELESNIVQISSSEIDAGKIIKSISTIPVYGRTQGSETNSVGISKYIFVPTCNDADLNNNGAVSFGDLSILSGCLGKDLATNPQCVIADIDRDGAVSFSDSNILGCCISLNQPFC